jgi:hypothetical protein
MNRWQRGQRRALHDSGLSHLQVMLLASVTSLVSGRACDAGHARAMRAPTS